MKQRLIEQVGRTTRLRVLYALKRTEEGLAVGELATRLGMSYMGVKELCVDLEKRGLLETWRHSAGTGRPRMLYRLTSRAQEIFPAASDAFTLDLLKAAQTLFGPSAAEKLLLVAFQKKTAAYAARLTGESLVQRARSLARLRDAEGCMSAVVQDEATGLRIVEHHSPLLEVLREFPLIGKLEAEMFERLLGVPVSREESGVAGLFCATYLLRDPGAVG